MQGGDFMHREVSKNNQLSICSWKVSQGFWGERTEMTWLEMVFEEHRCTPPWESLCPGRVHPTGSSFGSWINPLISHLSIWMWWPRRQSFSEMLVSLCLVLYVIPMKAATTEAHLPLLSMSINSPSHQTSYVFNVMTLASWISARWQLTFGGWSFTPMFS